MTQKEQLTAIHDTLIRMEPICRLVEKHEAQLNGNGFPGVRTQVKILWVSVTGIWTLVLAYLIETIIKKV